MSSSNVGNAQTYEANEQNAVEEQPDRFHEGKPHAHKHLDSKDERTIANKLAREEQRDQEGSEDSIETQRLKQDATLPAKAHGNKPSRGAEIDQELREEEEAILKKKGAFGPSASN
ncbi:hypothetical protein EG328_011026 [Venturia inaequalis]|uniref:Uncharacterized protein n=1 Tax=Venturia inaequalis TaxID=5025 RepID=A0A8H3U4M5_VENIN|nr:hypothetical protein EG328_011026 [Venturia inaequalis]KAE9971877.1 hypothetical protein EG327_009691 [Venturia inaequalis]